jgi:hypothetical protein
LTTVENELQSGKPQQSKIRESLHAMSKTAKSLAGGAAKTAIETAVTVAMKHLLTGNP